MEQTREMVSEKSRELSNKIDALFKEYGVDHGAAIFNYKGEEDSYSVNPFNITRGGQSLNIVKAQAHNLVDAIDEREKAGGLKWLSDSLFDMAVQFKGMSTLYGEKEKENETTQ